MIENCTIYGERCSGTNYLEDILTKNFDVNITWEYGWKHFFGFQSDEQLRNAKGTLFVCIVKDITSWINSFFRKPYHIPRHIKSNINNFITKEIYSNRDEHCTEKEIMEDRNMFTKNRYKNIFELRHTKLKYMIDELPNKVDHYILIRYEDLINDFDNVMHKLKEKGLTVRENISFPINSKVYKNGVEGNRIYKPNKVQYISEEQILKNPNFIRDYENILGYLK